VSIFYSFVIEQINDDDDDDDVCRSLSSDYVCTCCSFIRDWNESAVAGPHLPTQEEWKAELLSWLELVMVYPPEMGHRNLTRCWLTR